MASSETSQEFTFQSKLGLVLSCMGCVVGTGNIWRFPRIVANNSGDKGCLHFLLVWCSFLFLWSIPVIIVEYAVGRYTKQSPLLSFKKLLGPWSSWCGGWIAASTTFISAYYSVVIGWSFYYFFKSIFFSLPSSHDESIAVWDKMQTSSWPIFCHFLSIVVTSLCIAKAAKSIELVNKIIIPLLLALVVFSFYWSLSLKYSSYGITYFFSPDWGKLKNPRLWVDALAQNAWDTGAGDGLLLTYATYMTRRNTVVKMGTLIPMCNNIISILCCMTTFSTVFSTQMNKALPLSNDEIVTLLQNNGKANTGLTFIWMPILYNSFGSAGRVLCSLFFLCISLAGISSLMSLLELSVHTLQDMKVPRKYCLPLISVLSFTIGLASAIDVNFLVNQDTVWGYGLIISGSFVISIPLRYGAEKFRQELVNNFGLDDWNLPKLWVVVIKYLVPLQAMGLLGWWFYDSIHNTKNWYKLDKESLAMVLLQWTVVFSCLLAANFAWIYWKRSKQTNDSTTPSQYGATDSPSNAEA